VTYSGHVIANVATNNQLYTAMGSYTNRWNFATRTGNGSLNFDSGNYPVRTTLGTDNVSFTGSVLPHTDGDPNSIPSATPGVGSLSGAFISSGAGSLPNHAGLIGTFSLSTTRSDASSYVATGTFGAEAPIP
jgi:hypothetical protein